MPETGPTVVLPGRPLTSGELLDSAVLLLRGQAAVLLPLAAVLAAGEQLLLLPLRTAMGATGPLWWPSGLSEFGIFWFLLALGAATEAMIILLLGNPAAHAAAGALVDGRSAATDAWGPGGRWGATVLLCPAVGAVMLLASLLGPVWFIGFALLGAVAPALVVDRVAPVRAINRSVAMALRLTGRAAALRVLGYLVWWIIRVGLGWGLFTGVTALDLVTEGWADAVAMLVWAAVNTVAFAALACLDAVVHLETRIRTEGLDIRLARVPAAPRTKDLLAVGG
ncbi:hypothetical protein ACN26Z_06725 [Verrucosispora sp. WMMD703]|uniref:Uncharacterized protein n=1 Tax=Micromonospora sediminimaris TaxID=547162 RepID=A0A9W5XJ88_9ACTN|nr:hypothetical protein [Micromonospora sediminimaris]GIJ33080.1 hypothetical protein Vse01_22280 [Micromonospora sediminimaris]SFD13793.1 hypothetical protein SAMN05216284_111189 [Micromonospora sediminimaris]